MGDTPTKSELPRRLALLWVLAAPLGLPFSIRIIWEKTILTAREGEQMIGFSLVHLHPVFFIVGALSSLVLSVWVLFAIYYFVRLRFRINALWFLMAAGSLVAITAQFLPESFGLRLR
jgi:hypothetical protein